MKSERERLAPGRLMGGALRDLLRRPFSTLLFLNLFLSLVTMSIQSDDTGLLMWFVLAALTIYVQIATILAAGSAQAARSADPWIRAAFRARCFLRSVIVEVFTFVVVGLGLFFFVIGGLVAGAYLGLAQPALVLERLGVTHSIAKSAEIGEGRRKPIGIVFALLVLVPNVAVPLALAGGLDAFPIAGSALTFVAVALTMAGTIALTRAFVSLGGKPTPAPEEVQPRSRRK